MNPIAEGAVQIAQGPFWQQLAVGGKYKTWRRKITETDLVNFISCTGMLETFFINPSEETVMSGRVIPAALTYSLIEGFLFQGLIQGAGIALLDMAMKTVAPVRVGDVIWAVVETISVRPTSKHNRAIVKSLVTVMNQDDTVVLTYEVTRMVAGDPERT